MHHNTSSFVCLCVTTNLKIHVCRRGSNGDGKNIEKYCHLTVVTGGFFSSNILNIFEKWKWNFLSHVRLFVTPWTVACRTPLGQNTGEGSCSLLQGIFPTQGSNPSLPHCRWILYQLSYQGSSRILDWVAYPFSRRSYRCRNHTGVSCIAGGFFTSWGIRKAH